MKLGSVTKLNKKNKKKSKKLKMTSCRHILAIFLIYGKSGAIWNPDSGHIICKNYLFINSILLFCKN